jgi:hypothetical protein
VRYSAARLLLSLHSILNKYMMQDATHGAVCAQHEWAGFVQYISGAASTTKALLPATADFRVLLAIASYPDRINRQIRVFVKNLSDSGSTRDQSASMNASIDLSWSLQGRLHSTRNLARCNARNDNLPFLYSNGPICILPPFASTS